MPYSQIGQVTNFALCKLSENSESPGAKYVAPRAPKSAIRPVSAPPYRPFLDRFFLRRSEKSPSEEGDELAPQTLTSGCPY